MHSPSRRDTTVMTPYVPLHTFDVTCTHDTYFCLAGSAAYHCSTSRIAAALIARVSSSGTFPYLLCTLLIEVRDYHFVLQDLQSTGAWRDFCSEFHARKLHKVQQVFSCAASHVCKVVYKLPYCPTAFLQLQNPCLLVAVAKSKIEI